MNFKQKIKKVIKQSKFLRAIWQFYLFWIQPVFDIRRFLSAGLGYFWFFRDWNQYNKLDFPGRLNLSNAYPQLTDKTDKTYFDAHYLYQGIWALQRIAKSHKISHIDIGSQLPMVGAISSHKPVVFVDIRPAEIRHVDGLSLLDSSILDLPFRDQSIDSLSCMHVVEHIGLGRYGDPLDPEGTRKAISELIRVLRPGGELFFSAPIGKPRVCFNAHRIHAIRDFLEMFSQLELLDFSYVDDLDQFFPDADPCKVGTLDYGCGMFHFQR